VVLDVEEEEVLRVEAEWDDEVELEPVLQVNVYAHGVEREFPIKQGFHVHK